MAIFNSYVKLPEGKNGTQLEQRRGLFRRFALTRIEVTLDNAPCKGPDDISLSVDIKSSEMYFWYLLVIWSPEGIPSGNLT